MHVVDSILEFLCDKIYSFNQVIEVAVERDASNTIWCFPTLFTSRSSEKKKESIFLIYINIVSVKRTEIKLQ